jgi:hypothetical protein
MRKCRFCHEDIEEAVTCPHCRRHLIPERTTAPIRRSQAAHQGLCKIDPRFEQMEAPK